MNCHTDYRVERLPIRSALGAVTRSSRVYLSSRVEPVRLTKRAARRFLRSAREQGHKRIIVCRMPEGSLLLADF